MPDKPLADNAYSREPSGVATNAFSARSGAADSKIQRRRIGCNTTFAQTPAIIATQAAKSNTMFHPPCTASSVATGTSKAAVPFAVYNVPALPAA